jgi:hypothetical protein
MVLTLPLDPWDILVSKFAFKFSLCRYTLEAFADATPGNDNAARRGGAR